MKPYNDGISEIQMQMYRAMMEKKDKKEKAIKAAELARKIQMKSKPSNPWGENTGLNSVKSGSGSIAQINLKFSGEEKDRSMIIERN
jgi:hypothetical protein